MKVRIVPTVFATSKQQFDKRFNKLIEFADEIQIDFMDGKFVRGKSIKLSDVPNLKRYDIDFEAHLMIRNPETWLKRLKNKGFKKVIFHYQTVEPKKIKYLINEIHKLDMEAYIAINPKIHEEHLFPYIGIADGFLLMGVSPGAEKQRFIYKTYYKIENLRKKGKKLNIQVDGGVNLYTAKNLKDRGANILNSGSFISKSKDPLKAYEDLQRSVKT